jgi:cAMP-dependent protein kinase regulator
VREALKKRIEQAFMFSALNPEELSIVLDAMQNVKKAAGDQIIREGDEGDCLYVVESGTLSCTKIFVRYYFSLIYVERANRADIFEGVPCR